MFERELAATAAAMVAPGKGILAIDESSGTIKKRFDVISVESNTESRRAYRDLLRVTAEVHDCGLAVCEQLHQPQVLAGLDLIPALRTNHTGVAKR